MQTLRSCPRTTESKSPFNETLLPPIPVHVIEEHWLDQNFLASSGPAASSGLPASVFPCCSDQVTTSHSGRASP